MTRRLLLLCLLPALAAVGRSAEAADTGDARLRDALRSTTLQLRALEAERNTLQSAQTTLTAEKKAAEDKLATLRKEIVAERAVEEKAAAALKAQVAARDAEIAELKEALARAQTEHQQAAALAATREAERAKLAADLVIVLRKVADREAKNRALFKVGNEILSRYEKFSLGEALAAREPFVGATRTRLENLVQDYQDKLADERVKP